jgi:hypothetical protein
MKEREKEKLLTPTEFGEANKISRATVWRWLNYKHLRPRFKMYDAEPTIIAGKNFIKVK